MAQVWFDLIKLFSVLWAIAQHPAASGGKAVCDRDTVVAAHRSGDAGTMVRAYFEDYVTHRLQV